MGFIMQQGHLMKLGISSYPGVTFSSLQGGEWGMDTSQGRHRPGCAARDRTAAPRRDTSHRAFSKRLLQAMPRSRLN